MTIKLDHINLSVKDLKNSIDWYGRVFGFELVESGITANGKKWGIVAFNDYMICMSEFAERTDADKIEDRSAHQIFHFGIRVSDLNRWNQTVKDHQLKLYYGGEIKYPTSKSWYVHDPSGHEIEVSYTEQGRMQFPNGGII